MAKNPATPPIPPLAVKQAHELEALEARLARALEGCMDPHGNLAHELKASTYLSSYVVKIFSLYSAAYIGSPNFRLWTPQLKAMSVQWALNCLADYRGTSPSMILAYKKMLLGALDEHLKTAHGNSLNPLLRQLGEVLSTVAPTVDKMRASRPASVATDARIGSQIRDLMNEARLTKEQLAEGIGIQERNVYRHLAGTPPRAKTLAAYEEFFSKRLKRSVQLKTS